MEVLGNLSSQKGLFALSIKLILLHSLVKTVATFVAGTRSAALVWSVS
jgi:hypothetical protein